MTSDDSWTPPKTETSSAPRSLRVGVALCLLLGVLGVLMTSYSGLILWVTQTGLMDVAVSPEQGQVMEELRTQQSWWVLPVAAVQTLLKMALSVGLVVGSVQVLRRRPSGPEILRPILIFGIAFELILGLWGATSTLWNWEKMSEQFGASMAANPGVPAEVAQGAGTAFGVAMVIAMVFVFLWAGVKAGLYEWTRRGLASEAGESWIRTGSD